MLVNSISSSELNQNGDVVKISPNDPPKKGNPVNPFLGKDELNFSKSKNNEPPFGEKNVFSDTDPEKKGNGWKIKSVHFNYGYVLDNDVIHNSPMRISNPEQGTDLTITGYHQIDRKNWENLTMKDGSRFAPDEPQFIMAFNATFENNFGIELDGKHNKIIMDGYDQNVHFSGTMNGSAINQTAPLNTYMQQHEQTFGNMQISALGTYTFDLPSPGNHKFSFITKAGPSIITTNTKSTLKQPDGTFAHSVSPLVVAGYGGTVENGIRYQFGPKVKGLGLELTHSMSYLNYTNYPMVNGTTGSHSAVYNTVALKATVNLFGNK